MPTPAHGEDQPRVATRNAIPVEARGQGAVDSQPQEDGGLELQEPTGGESPAQIEPTSAPAVQGSPAELTTNQPASSTFTGIDSLCEALVSQLSPQAQIALRDGGDGVPFEPTAEDVEIIAVLVYYRECQRRAVPCSGAPLPPAQTAASSSTQSRGLSSNARADDIAQPLPRPQARAPSSAKTRGSKSRGGASKVAAGVSTKGRPPKNKDNSGNRRMSIQEMSAPYAPPNTVGRTPDHHCGQFQLNASAPAHFLPQSLLPGFRSASDTFVPPTIVKEPRKRNQCKPKPSDTPAPSLTNPAPPLRDRTYIWCGYRVPADERDENNDFPYERCTYLLPRNEASIKLHYMQEHGALCRWHPSCLRGGRKLKNPAPHIWGKHIQGGQRVCEGKRCLVEQAPGSDWCPDQGCGCIAPLPENIGPSI